MALLAVVLLVAVVTVVGAGIAGVYFYWRTLGRLRGLRDEIDSVASTIRDRVEQEFQALDPLVAVAEEYMKRQQEELSMIRDLSLDEDRSLDGLAEQHGMFTDRVEAFLQEASTFPELAEDERFVEARNRVRDRRVEVAESFRQYNNAVERYNMTISDFPHRYVAAWEGFEQADRIVL